MSNPWDNDPVATAAAPWLKDAQVAPSPAAPPAGVPMRATAAAPPPSVGDRVRNGLSAGLNMAADTIDSVGGLVGQGVGLLGGLAGALGVQLRGGVQPDDPRVLAAGTGAVNGADARPLAAGGRGTGETPVPQDAIDEAGQQGAQGVVGALHSGPSTNISGPGRDIANSVEAPGGLLAHIDPQIAMTMHAPAGAMADGTSAVGSAARAAAVPMTRAAGKVAGMVGDAAGGAAKAVAKAIVQPDPELVKVAQLNDSLEHPLPITSDKLTLDSAGNSNPAQVRAGDEAVTKNLIGMINPDETAARLTPKVLDAALDRSGGIIGDIAERTPIPAGQMDSALQPLVKTAIDEGAGDVPRIIPNLAKSLMDTADEDGSIPGTAFRKWDSNVGAKIRTTTDGGLRDELMQLQKSARDTMASNITDPADVDALKAARKQYAYGMIVAPDVASTVTGLYPADQLMNRVTANARGKRLMATDAGGDIGDLAKVAELYTRKAPGSAVNPPTTVQSILTNSAAKAVNMVPGVKSATQAVSNKAGQGVARMLVPKTEPAPVTPPVTPPELELAPPGAVNPPVAPPPAGPLGDLTPDWETAPGAAAPSARGAPVDATDLHPALGDNVVTTGNPAPPSAGGPGSQIPAVPGRPDLPDAMISGRPGETAATDAANAAMTEPGAVAARAAQSAADEGAAAQKAAEAAAAPKPNAAEQTRLDEIDKTIAGTQSTIVRETLEKERARVMKDVAARDTVDKTKAAADELRTTAAAIADPTTQKAMLARADKLDPPPKPALAKPNEEPLPSIEYADTPEWRKAHGLGPEDAQRAILTRKAYDLDADAVDAAAVQHASSPRAFDRVVDQILEKHHANEATPAADGGQGPQADQAPSQKPAASGDIGEKPTAGTAEGAGSGRAAGAAGPGGQPHVPDVSDHAAEAARQAKFHLDHPRDVDGKFIEKD